MDKSIVWIGVASVLGCAGPTPPTPKQRYVAAVNSKYEGDAQGYHDQLIALAHDAPESRAGRRARATLGSGDTVGSVILMGVLLGVAVPNYVRYQQRSKQSAAKISLREAATLLESHRAAHGAYPTTFEPALGQAVHPPYLLFFAPGQAVGSPSHHDMQQEAADMLRSLSIEPHLTTEGFLLVAVASLTDDGSFDVWTIDHNGHLLHVLDDLQ